MKWKDLSLKERKQIYDSARKNNPGATYFDIRAEFDSIPAYEEGKESKWLTDKQYRDSVMHVQDSIRDARELNINKFTSPDIETLANDTTIKGSSSEVDKEINLVMDALKSKAYNFTSDKIKQAVDEQYTRKTERLEPLKEWAKISGILGQAALGAGSIIAKNAGNAVLGAGFQGAGALWDGLETIQAVNDNDKTGILQNIIPIISQGVAGIKYLPKYKLKNSLIIDSAENLGPVWDFTINPAIESVKASREVPAYQDGKGSKISLPENTFGTPEYFERQRRISGRANVVQPEVYVTPAGYAKDAMDFVKNVSEGDYTSAIGDVLLNAIPWGVGKGLKNLQSKVRKAVGTTEEVSLDSKNAARTPKVKVKKGKATMSEEDAEVVARRLRKQKNVSLYDKEFSTVLWDAYGPDTYTRDLVKGVDESFGTSYYKAYGKLLHKDMSNRGKYVKYVPKAKGKVGEINYDNDKLSIDHYGKTEMTPEAWERYHADPDNFVATPDDFVISINTNRFNPGTVAHELSHVTDAIVNNEFSPTANNRYLDWLLDRDNTISPAMARSKGIILDQGTYDYLTIPTEAKAHMIQLRRELLEKGEIGTLLQPIDRSMIERHTTGPDIFQNPMLIHQYNMYNNKDRFIQRMNQLIPIEYAVPVGVSGIIGAQMNEQK